MDKNTLWALGIILFVGFLGWFLFTQNTTELAVDETLSEEENQEEIKETEQNTQPRTQAPPRTQPVQIEQKPIQEIPEGTVSYTNSGFMPNTITVTAGNSISFVNNSDMALRIVSEPEYGETAYKGLHQSKSEPKGSVFTFTFTQVGTWSYTNLNNKNHIGFITVLPQP